MSVLNSFSVKILKSDEKSLEHQFFWYPKKEFYATMIYVTCENKMYVNNEVSDMAVSYKKLFKMLIDRDMKKKDFRELTGISSNTVTKLANNENVTMEVIEKICIHMNCTVDEIVDIIPDDQVNENREKTVE